MTKAGNSEMGIFILNGGFLRIYPMKRNNHLFVSFCPELMKIIIIIKIAETLGGT